MPGTIVCKLCNKRRAKRACPAVHGEICAICCGEQREVTLFCPLDCEYLREAHKHEKPVAVTREQIANPDVEITENFLASHDQLLLYVAYTLLEATLATSHAVDSDVMEALAALIKTRKTAQSGLIYEVRPDNLVAHSIQHKLNEALSGFEAEFRRKSPVAPSPDADIFKVLVFLHRIGQQSQNGRPKGRMFTDFLRGMVPDARVDERAPSIII